MVRVSFSYTPTLHLRVGSVELDGALDLAFLAYNPVYQTKQLISTLILVRYLKFFLSVKVIHDVLSTYNALAHLGSFVGRFPLVIENFSR